MLNYNGVMMFSTPHPPFPKSSVLDEVRYVFVFASIRLQVMGYRVWGVLAGAGGPRGARALHSLRQQKNCQRRLRRVSVAPSPWALCVVVLSGVLS